MRVLVLGGTGAMGSHLCRLLAARGHDVVCTSRRAREPFAGVTYAVGDAKERPFLEGLLSERWGAVVDFMIWSTDEFRARYRDFLDSTGQYVFTSSYRVYADSPVITEGSPRLLDVADDRDYLASDEYALRKARCEDMLFASGSTNWTVVRPAVTYDGASGRLQLGVYESEEWLWRAARGVPVPMPSEMLCRQATMSYGGDVAEMISLLVGNSSALGEAFTVSGSDHMTWREVAEAYAEVLPFEMADCSVEALVAARGGRYQVLYDRMFDRVVDNSKVLRATGMDAVSLTGMRNGLMRELGTFIASGASLRLRSGLQGRYDRLSGGVSSLRAVASEGGMAGVAKYLVRRCL